MSGFLTPDARLRTFSDLGVVLPGAKLYAYVAGTPATPLDTYSDVALTTPNANPVVASAGGLFGPIYLTKGVSYKFVLKDADGGAIWSQDYVSTPTDNTLAAGSGISLATVAGVTTVSVTEATVLHTMGVQDFRLTLESGVPVSSTDQLAKGTLYCTSNGRGNRMDVYDAAGVPTTYTSAQFSIAVPAVANQVYSVFVYQLAGVLTLELTAWTNDTTPGAAAYAIAANGVYCKTGDLTRRAIGVIRTKSASQVEDSAACRHVANIDNACPRPMRVLETTDSWTYSVDTWRQANGAAANLLDFVVAVDARPVRARVYANSYQSAADIGGTVGVGLDSTSAVHASCVRQPGHNSTGSYVLPESASLEVFAGVGRHTLVWLERARAAGTHTYYGDTSVNIAGVTAAIQSGMDGLVWG